jgi:hypothetical protein
MSTKSSVRRTSPNLFVIFRFLPSFAFHRNGCCNIEKTRKTPEKPGAFSIKMLRNAIGRKTLVCTPITKKAADTPVLFRRFRQLFCAIGTSSPYPFCASSAQLPPGGPILRKCVKRGAAFFQGSGDINKDHPPGLCRSHKDRGRWSELRELVIFFILWLDTSITLCYT